jgi:hypothetical protein
MKASLYFIKKHSDKTDIIYRRIQVWSAVSVLDKHSVVTMDKTTLRPSYTAPMTGWPRTYARPPLRELFPAFVEANPEWQRSWDMFAKAAAASASGSAQDPGPWNTDAAEQFFGTGTAHE